MGASAVQAIGPKDRVRIAGFGKRRGGGRRRARRGRDKKTVKNRLYIDVSPEPGQQDQEVERILGLGATHADVGQGPDVSWVVLADPEGNEFCVLRGKSETWVTGWPVAS